MTNIQVYKKEDSFPVHFKKPYEASISKKIIDSDDFSIKQAVGYVITILSITPENYPDSTQLMVLIDFLKRNYSTLTLEETKLSFDYYMSEKLELKKDHFGRLSVEFFTHVLNAYKRLIKTELNKELRIIEDRKRREEITKPTRQYTDEECFNYINDFVSKKKELPLACPWWHGAFLHAEKVGLINLSNEEKAKFMEEVKKSYMNSGTHGLTPPNEKRQPFNYLMWSNKELLKVECRERMIKEYFKKLIK